MSVRLGLVGAGLVGARHIAAISTAPGARLVAIADPAPDARDAALATGAETYADFNEMLAAGGLDGVILATPNRLHGVQAQAAIAAGLPVLVEKPLTDDVAEGAALVAAAQAAGVPLLTGHHRRYNPLVQRAKHLVDAGTLGDILSVQASCWLKKSDPYFAPPWRRQRGAGPVLVNLIHDVDLLRYFCGDVVSVQAQSANTARGHDVEDTAVCLLRFASGALATMSLSDAIPAPVSWELTAGENPAYPRTDQSCYWFGGTKATLALPALTLWRHDGPEGWWSPISATRVPVPAADPLVEQIAHFADVIEGKANPRVSGRDGLEATRVIAAILEAAETGATVDLPIDNALPA